MKILDENLTRQSEFYCCKIQTIEDDGSMYRTATEGASLYITKDGVSLTLNEQEILQLARTMEANFRN